MSPATAFSVIVPAFDRPERIRRCVAALGRLEWPADRLEAVVVDDGSVEPLDAAALAGEAPRLRLRVIRQANAGPAAARNRGAAEAIHPHLAFTDDDCEPRPDWLARFADRLAERPAAMLGGAFVNATPENPAAVASHFVTELFYERGVRAGRGSGPDGAWLFVTANLCVPREAFLAVGGFDERFPLPAGEDFDFCHRFQHAGHPAAYAPEAAVDHFHPMGLAAFWRQHRGYGGGSLQFRVRASARRGAAATAGLGGFHAELVRRAIGRVRRPRHVVEGMHIALSQVAAAAGVLAESRRLRRGTAAGRRVA
ncbi:glycosyltransferase [Phycisphaera mikurensis]|uniref:Putative glycosyltransferase n=1 Tax=Phycisphaera mikurensis (strain NBRC 102666 / KCTC 22515 / FYK2301M01) TaxID=1142394 RepID=I0IFT3_PHYMF|nr:glycosyltransferase [Phycisphaera mikurensis]MBB6440490.1 GT2 family glycosyltransferase [Phycisphaera mikurensis]BAM04121.1 putative glycosyltransferase [Phycisphaera mikurensis NBRC 102666]